MKKIFVNLPDGVVEILDREFVGKIGEDYNDVLRTIIMNVLVEQGYLPKDGKAKDHNSKREHTPENEPFYTS
jgi:hypothetical protein